MRKMILPATLFLASVALFLGCGENPAEPRVENGAIEISSVTVGEPPDPDGYTLAVDGGPGAALGPNSTLTLSAVSPGDHRLELGGVAPHCAVSGANPRTLAVSAGSTARTSFAVECRTPQGSLEVSATTTGESPDPDGYTVMLDQAPGPPLAPNGAIAFRGVIAGDHRVRLGGLAPNCAVAGENPRTVAVGTDTARTAFEIDCGPPSGTLTVVAATAGPRPDPDGYQITLGDSAPRPIGANASLTVVDVPAGDLSVRLGGVASNCALAGENPRTVMVVNGGSSRVTFEVTCLPTGPGTILFESDRSGTSHLYRMRPDGSKIVDLTPAAEACCGDWSPDGSRIAFTAFGETPGIAIMNADGSDPVGLGVSGGGPRWSPDGRRILLVSGGTIQVMNADGSGVTPLTTGSLPDWSPDGSRIAFQRIGQCVADICGADIYVMAADGSQVRRVTSGPSPFDFSGGPAWSPDGTEIAYQRHSLFGASGFYVIKPDGSGRRALTDRSGLGRPVWSPDGSAILVAAYTSGGGSTELLALPSGGGEGVVLASSLGSEYPQSWK